jgi:epoxyqueuosine reductase
MTPEQLTQSLKSEAHRLGFALSGTCPAVTPAGLHQFHDWLDRGFGGEMDYLTRRREAYAHPNSIVAGAQSILMLGFPYRSKNPNSAGSGQGLVSRYAWSGADYHDFIHDRLQSLKQHMLLVVPHATVRAVVDTAPLLEREFAALAGLGWQAKNTLLINREWGSWFYLSALITDVVLNYDQPRTTDHCGTCTACLEACPTAAFVAPRVLDANRCISYLTIEHRSAIPKSLREPMGDWVFGCDVCQDVCPWNHKVAPSPAAEVQSHRELDPLSLVPLFFLSDEEFRARFRRTPLWRPKRRGILRNAAIVLGNQRSIASVPALVHGLRDAEPLVRGAAAWALGRIRNSESITALQSRLAMESDADVRAEIDDALHAR